MKWQKIDSAPKDETRLLLWLPKHDLAISGAWVYFDPELSEGYMLYPGFYGWAIDEDVFIMDDPDEEPSHWMLLPEVKR